MQRRASNTGVIMVAGQKVAIGRQFHHQTVTVHVGESTLAIELPEGDTRVVRRTNDQAVRTLTIVPHAIVLLMPAMVVATGSPLLAVFAGTLYGTSRALLAIVLSLPMSGPSNALDMLALRLSLARVGRLLAPRLGLLVVARSVLWV